MEAEGEADRKEESAEPRNGGGARAVNGEAEPEADRSAKYRDRSRMEVQGSRRDGRAGSQFSTWERDHPEANREGFILVRSWLWFTWTLPTLLPQVALVLQLFPMRPISRFH